jgi:hypothetical protein
MFIFLELRNSTNIFCLHLNTFDLFSEYAQVLSVYLPEYAKINKRMQKIKFDF